MNADKDPVIIARVISMLELPGDGEEREELRHYIAGEFAKELHNIFGSRFNRGKFEEDCL